jgi:hypothetical protein
MTRTRSAGAIVAATAVVALLTAACGGGTPSAGSGGPRSAGGSSRSPSAVAFSACMRSHAVPNFPDPGAGGRPLEVDAQQLGVSDSLYQAAEHACRHLLPTGGSLEQLTHQCLLYGACPQSLVQQLVTLERRYAGCMRSHGVPSWPDPSISPKGGRPVFDLSGAGIDPRSTDSPQFVSKDRECRRLHGGSVPSLPFT